MNLNPAWNRRTFLTTLGLTTAAATLPAATRPDAASAQPVLRSRPARPAFAFVSTVNFVLGGSRAINTYRVEDGRWTEVEYPFDTYFPDTLAAHPTLPVLYTASMPQFGPSGDSRRGRATAIRIDDNSFISGESTLERNRHRLAEINSQPLALATTRPRQIAVSPDGQYLLVADAEGGHYNLLPLAGDGSLLPVAHVLKQTGSGPHITQTGPQPHSVLFHPHTSIAYTTDAGSDRLNLLSLAEEQPRISDRLSFAAGSGPAHLTLHPTASFLIVTSQLRPALSVVSLDPQTGAFSAAVSHVALPGKQAAGPSVSNAAGTLVYATSFARSQTPRLILSTLRLSRSGRLTSVSEQAIPHLSHVASLTLHDTELVLVGDDGIVTIPLADRTGLPGSPVHVVPGICGTGIVFRTV